MDIMEWARKEVEIFYEREKGNMSFSEYDYMCACYESALKALESLVSDNHSGMSIGVTQNVLNRLIDKKPLTPIEDTDDIWEACEHVKECCKATYRCKRMSSLFKDVLKDGTVIYLDVGRVYAIDIDHPETIYYSSLVAGVINEMFPITIPYMPGEPIKVCCEDFSIDNPDGNFDVMGIFYAIETENGEQNIIEINRFFKENLDGEWTEINRDEYDKLFKGVK